MNRHRILVGMAVVVLAAACWGGAACAFSEVGTTTTSGTTERPTSTERTSTTRPSSTTTVRPSTTMAPPSTVRPTTTVAPSSTTSPPTNTAGPAKDYTRLPTDEKVVALTFDAAYDPAPLQDILAALEEAGARATFFLTGEFVRDFPEWTKKIAAGYPIGNHSYSHPDFTELSDAEMHTEIEKMETALAGLDLPDPKPLFRAPYGALNKRVLSVLGSKGYISVFWTIDTLDWETDRTPAQIKAAVLNKLEPGAIVLMHVGSKQTAQILPEILAEISARGYRFVDLREALPGYE